jgi:hypothetical protein
MSLRPQSDPFAAQRLEIWGQRSGTFVMRDSVQWSPASLAGEVTSTSSEWEGRTRPAIAGFVHEGAPVASGTGLRRMHARAKSSSVRGASDVSGFCGGSSYEY